MKPGHIYMKTSMSYMTMGRVDDPHFQQFVGVTTIMLPRTKEGERYYGEGLMLGWPFNFTWFDHGAIMQQGHIFLMTSDIRPYWQPGRDSRELTVDFL